MELFKTIRERHETSKQENVRRRAEELITIEDFDGSLYIAIGDIPAILIDGESTVSQAVEQLENLRSNYINYIMKK